MDRYQTDTLRLRYEGNNPLRYTVFQKNNPFDFWMYSLIFKQALTPVYQS